MRITRVTSYVPILTINRVETDIKTMCWRMSVFVRSGKYRVLLNAHAPETVPTSGYSLKTRWKRLKQENWEMHY